MGLLAALSRVGERNSAEIARVMASYFRRSRRVRAGIARRVARRPALRGGDRTRRRPEDEFTSGHLPGALNIPLSQLERRLAELPPDQEIVAYCRGPWCVLSFEAVALLRQRGYRARRLEDGFPEWKTAGLPTSQKISGGNYFRLVLTHSPRVHPLVTEQLVATEPGIGVPQGNTPDRDRTNTKPWVRVSRHRGRNHNHKP